MCVGGQAKKIKIKSSEQQHCRWKHLVDEKVKRGLEEWWELAG